MIKLLKILPFFLLSSIGSVHATTFLIQEDKVEEVSCSSRGLTRIALEEGEIAQVITQDEIVDYFLTSNGTQIIINSLSTEAPFFVVSSKGNTASLILKPKQNPIENHLLAFADYNDPEIVMKRILNNERVKDYQVKELDTVHKQGMATMRNKKIFTNDINELLLFSIKNESGGVLKTADFGFANSVKTIYEKTTINPGEECNAVAIIKKL